MFTFGQVAPEALETKEPRENMSEATHDETLHSLLSASTGSTDMPKTYQVQMGILTHMSLTPWRMNPRLLLQQIA